MHQHLCYGCETVLAEGNFDCDEDRDHDFAFCERCICEARKKATEWAAMWAAAEEAYQKDLLD